MREPEPPRKVNPAVSKEGERIILKLLAKDKTQRYQTATELRSDLEQLVGALRLCSHRQQLRRDCGPRRGALSRLFRHYWRRTRDRAGDRRLSSGGTAIRASRSWEDRLPPLPSSTNETPSSSPTSLTRPAISVFDTTLTQALEIQLEQSPFLTIVSQQHLRQSLQYLGKPLRHQDHSGNRPRDRHPRRHQGNHQRHHLPAGQPIHRHPRGAVHRQRRLHRQRTGPGRRQGTRPHRPRPGDHRPARKARRIAEFHSEA